MSADDLVLLQGLRRTRSTFERWNADPLPVLGRWLGAALAVAVALLGAVWVVARLSTPDPTPFIMPGLQIRPTLGAVGVVLVRNSLVLALHAFACVAGFIAGSSLPAEAERHSGAWRWDELLAATFVTLAMAIPTLVAASVVEVYVSPRLLAAVAGG